MTDRTSRSRFGEPPGLLIGGIAVGVGGVMAVAEFGLAHSIGGRNLKHVAGYGAALSSAALIYISQAGDGPVLVAVPRDGRPRPGLRTDLRRRQGRAVLHDQQ